MLERSGLPLTPTVGRGGCVMRGVVVWRFEARARAGSRSGPYCVYVCVCVCRFRRWYRGGEEEAEMEMG